MPLWMQHRWGHARWGALGLPDAYQLRAKILSGNSPWFLKSGLQNPYRAATFEIWTVNPSTLENDELVPLIGSGQRIVEYGDWWRQKETLTFGLQDPAQFGEGGPYENMLPVGKLIRVQWRVRSQYGSMVFPVNIYRITKAPIVRLDTLGQQPENVEAEDWLGDPLRTRFFSGFGCTRELIQLKDFVLPDGPPVVGSPDSWATLLAALLYVVSGHHVSLGDVWRTMNWWGSSATDPLLPPPMALPDGTIPSCTITSNISTVPNATPTNLAITWSYAPDDTMVGDWIVYIRQSLVGVPNAIWLASAQRFETGGLREGSMTINVNTDMIIGNALLVYYHRVYGFVGTPKVITVTY